MTIPHLTKARLTKAITELGPEFYDLVEPARFPKEILRYWNDPLCDEMGWATDFATSEAKALHFQRFEPFPDSLSQPLALRYHGHQFQHYNPDLGDGRGFLYAQAEWRGKLWDFGTKGSGQTPYSRFGDGRLTLKGAFREALATEMLESLGVNTSRTYCFFETGEDLDRNDEPSPTRSAVLTRFSHSHVRIGTFQRLAALGETANIEKLLRYCARHLLPELAGIDDIEVLARNFLITVSRRLAHLSAQWMIAGFVHGVLNSDNLNITGESFDYGPYRFLPHYDSGFTAAYFDQRGLYCFGRQPSAVAWALERLGESLSILVPQLPIQETMNHFGVAFGESLALLFCHRLNLQAKASAETAELMRAFFQFQEAVPTAYEQTYFDLIRGEYATRRRESSPQNKSYESESGRSLLHLLETFETGSAERAAHPYLSRSAPVTLLIDEIESLWKDIATHDDWSPFHRKIVEIRSFRGLFPMSQQPATIPVTF